MNKLHIFGLMALATVGFTACNPDESPKINKPTEFVLNTPPFAEQLYELSANGVIEFTCSQPNYGLTLAPAYTIEISLLEDFGASATVNDGDAPLTYSILPDDPYSGVINIHEVDIAKGICAMNGIESEEDYVDLPVAPLYVRAVAAINDQPLTRIESNIITLKNVKCFSPFGAVALQVLYTPGASNGWNHANSQQIQYSEDSGLYWGFAYLTGEFKFTNAPDWNGTNFGNGGDGKLDTDGGAGNLSVDVPGLYYLTVDVDNLTYTATLVSSLSTIGSFNDWSADNALTPSDDFLTWTGTINFSADGEFKFRANNDWGINLGGALNNLIYNGGNIGMEAGSYNITLNLSSLPYKATVEPTE